MISDVVLINFLACVLDDRIADELSKTHKFQVVERAELGKYIKREDFLSKTVTIDNFENCLNFAKKYLDNEEFKEELLDRDICFIKYYPRVDKEGNILDRNPELAKLNNKIIKKCIVDDKLMIYTHPIGKWKDEILYNSEEIIDFFEKNGKSIKSIEVKYLEDGEMLDEASSLLIDIGCTLLENKK